MQYSIRLFPLQVIQTWQVITQLQCLNSANVIFDQNCQSHCAFYTLHLKSLHVFKKRLIKTHSFDSFSWIAIVFLLISTQFNYLQFPTSGRHSNAIFNIFMDSLQGIWVWCRCDGNKTVFTSAFNFSIEYR